MFSHGAKAYETPRAEHPKAFPFFKPNTCRRQLTTQNRPFFFPQASQAGRQHNATVTPSLLTKTGLLGTVRVLVRGYRVF